MKKRIITAIVLVCLMASVFPVSAFAGVAFQPRCEAHADALYELGLFKGTGTKADGTPVYSLEMTPDRAACLVMLIRLLGEEEAALSHTGTSPFTDMNGHWAEKYVAYAYEKGYTSGTGANTFDPSGKASANMYLTFLLRALGYDDRAGDFSYDNAANFAYTKGICGYNEFAGRDFYRDDCVYTSVNALKLNLNGYYTTLLDSLVKKGAVDKTAANAFKKKTIEKADILDYTVIDIVIGKTLSEIKSAYPGGTQDTNGTDIFYTFRHAGQYVTCMLTGGKCVSVEGHISVFVKGADNSMTRNDIALLLGDAYGTGDFGNFYATNTTGFHTCIGGAGIFTYWQQTKYIQGWSLTYSVQDVYTSENWMIGSMGRNWFSANGVFGASLSITKASPEKLYAKVGFHQLALAQRVAETGVCTFWSFDGGKTYKASGVYDNWGNRINITLTFINDAAIIQVETTKADQMANFCFNSRFVVFGAVGGVTPASF